METLADGPNRYYLNSNYTLKIPTTLDNALQFDKLDDSLIKSSLEESAMQPCLLIQNDQRDG